MKLVLAGDLGGTHLRTALIDASGRVREARTAVLPAPRGRQDVIDALEGAFAPMMKARPCAVSLSIKGRVDAQRGLSLAMIMTSGWNDVPLAAILKAKFRLPVLLENDARCAALGEAWKGRGRGKKDFVFIIVGTGIGSGIVRDGRLYRGAAGHAGEFGHIVIDDSDREFLCACGEFGHWEALAAGPALAARKRSRAAKTAVAETGRRLGTGLYNVVRAEDPSLIVLGGGVAKEGKPLLDAARRECAARLGVFGIACPRIVLSSLGDRAGLLGAARRALTLDRTPAPR